MLRMDGAGFRHWAKAPDGQRIYAVGDVHGRLDLLDEMHELILADARDAPGRRVIVYLGDYIDRGPKIREVIDRLLEGPPDGFEAVHLRGNHEDIMLGFMDAGTQGASWFRHGGRETLASYGIEAPSPSDEAAFPAARAALRAHLPATHRAFIDATQLMYRAGDYLFVHAGVRPGVALGEQDINDFMWIRNEFLESDAHHGVCVVHGHTIEPGVVVRDNRIGLDTGAYRTDRLSCAVIEGGRIRLLQT